MNLFASFSGGETSAYMTHLLLTKWRDRYDDVAVVFANTGQENEQTLEFVRDCDTRLGFNTVWLEAVVQSGRVGTKHKVVAFDAANRDGKPFEDVIQKYGIPNQKFPHCTRELKLNPMRSYIESLGWKRGTYDTAVGIRADEAKRRSAGAAEARVVYPFLDWLRTTKPQVNAFWGGQPFRLRLAGYQGNCKWCWKKSTRKLMTVMDDDPSIFDFPERMEAEYGLVGPEFKKTVADGYRRVFFRKNLSASDLRLVHANDDWQRAENDAVVYEGKQLKLDIEPGDGCTESCEVNWA